MERKFVLAMDHGFRSVKVCIDNHFDKYDTILSEPETTLIEWDDESDIILFDGKKYLVGAEAMREVHTIHTREIEYILKYAPLFTHYVLKKTREEYGITQEQIKALSVGLPLRDYRTNREIFKNTLSNFEVAGVRYAFDNVIVSQQGIGGFADMLVRKPPQEHDEGYILDVGENTVILVRYANRKAIANGSEQLDRMGISQVVDDLRPVVEKKLGRALSLGELRKLITGESIVHRGERYNFKEEVAATISNYVTKLIEMVFDKRKEQFDRCARITLIGGGAYYISQYIPEDYKGLIEIAPHPEYANVRGYAYIGHQRTRKG